MTKQNKYSFARRALALALALVLGFSLLPTDGLVTFAESAQKPSGALGVVQTADDPPTLTRPGETFQSSAGIGSTLNAGKILVGKSVTDGIKDGTNTAEALDLSSELTNMPSGSTTSWLPDENNFLVTISQSSQMYGISSRIPVPMDVVFVIDTSGSMNTGVGNNQDRADAVMAAANSAIKTLLEANDDNRVGVVAFSGDSGRDSDATTVLTALGHYSTTSDHLTMSWDGDLTGKTGSRDARSGGTNIQAGIAAGAQMLMNARDLTVQYGDRTVTRIPVLVILSDGAPTFSSSALDWTNPTGGENGRGNEDRGVLPGEGFLPMLTAAYYKNAITQRYYGNGATSDQRAFVYTIGVGLGTIQQQNNGSYRAGDVATLANLTMNPSDWLGVSISNTTIDDAINTAWTNYQNKSNFTINVGQYMYGTQTYSFRYHATSTDARYNIDPSVTSLKYNDKYWPASSTEEINSAFSEMVIEIQKRAITAPTLTNTTWGQDYSGFVTFTDPIGEYMEVKNIIGVTGDGYLYQGISLSQLAEGYNPDWETDSSTTETQAAFNAALEQAFKDRMSLSTAAGAATPTIAQVRSILDVITRTESEGDVTYNAGGGNTRTFDYATYGGQLYYESDTDYGNSFVWFGKVHYPDGETEATANDDYDVQFIGVAPKNADSIDWLHNGGDAAVALRESAKAAGANCIVRSYFMYGTAAGNREGDPADMLHFQLRVITSLEEPHQQYVSIKAPASLLAMQKVLIDDTDLNNLEAHYDELIPSRVIYEVGLRSDINANTVWDIVDEDYLTETLSDGTLANVNSDGTINFYTNDWDRAASVETHERALAHANFEVSNNNSFYRYETNTALFDMNGNPLTTKPVAGQQYKYERTYYTWTTESDGVSKATKNTVMITVTAPADQTVVDAQAVQDTAGTWGGVQNQWYIRAGVYSDNTLTAGDNILKSANTTGTAAVVTHPVHADDLNDPKYTTWLGNNGKLLFYGVKTKTVTGDDLTTSDSEANAEIDGKPVMVGDTLTYTLQAANTEANAATITITDTIPAGTALVAESITASAGGTYAVSGNKITWTFTNVAVNGVVEAGFKVLVLEEAFSNTVTNQGSIKIGENTYNTNITSNPVTGKQAMTPSGSAIPEGGLKVGDSIEYQIAYHNNTDKVATITVTDVVPEGTTVALVTVDDVTRPVTSHPDELVWNQSTETLTWTLQNVQPGTGGVITFTVIINASVDKITVGDESALGVQNSATYVVKPENEPGVTVVTNPTQTLVETGDLTVAKVVTGTTATKTFDITLTESTRKLNGTFATNVDGTKITFTNGVATVNLKANESITIKGLPVGVIIAVNEATPGAGYTASYSSAAATVIAGTTPAGVTVTNTYKADDTDDISTMFTLKKTLESAVDLSGRTFTFLAQAASENGAVLTGDKAETLTATGTVEDGQTVDVNFHGKTFSAVGDYYYLVTEYEGVLGGITYAKNQYLVKISVTDNGEGKLVAAVTSKSRANADASWPTDWSAATELNFTNSYKPADTSIVLTGTKTLTGRDLIAGEFTFKAEEVAAPAGVDRDVVRYGHHDENGNITFDPIYYSVKGTYKYKITELDTTGQKFVTFDDRELTVVVEVTSNDGVLSAAVVAAESDEISFTNTYTTQDVSVTPEGTKVLTGRPMQAGEFSFEVYDENGVVKSRGSIVAKDPANSTEAGKSGEEVTIHFTPITYSLADLGEATEKVFTYTIKELLPTVRAEDGLTYDKSEYTFTVKVTYDAVSGTLSTEMSAITQTKNSAGEEIPSGNTTVKFANSYNPPPVDVKPGDTSIGLGINKVINSESEIPDGLTFGFLVYKADNAYELKADGTEDTTKVISDGYTVYDGTANTASSALVGTGVSEETDGAVDGSTYAVSFSELTFSKPGIYKAWIVEANAGAENLHGVTYAATRYLMVVKITHNTGTGKLDAQVKYYNAGTVRDAWTAATYIADTNLAAVPLAFENTYSAKGSMVISATKAITGRNLADVANKFDFTLTELDADGKPTTNVHVGKNDADGNIVFDTLNFAEFTGDSKTITYLMAETAGVLDGITYDKSQYKVTIKLTHDGKGGIVGVIESITKVMDAAGNAVNVSQTAQDAANGVTGIEFANVGNIYKGTSVKIPVSKKLIGRDMTAGEFVFELIHFDTQVGDVDQDVVPTTVATVTVSGSAKGVAEKMNFIREYGTGVVPGTIITYHVVENPNVKSDIAYYDKSVYEVKVEITDNDQNGELESQIISVVQLKNAGGADVNETKTQNDILFTNIYLAPDTLTLTGTKTLTGRGISEGEFVFEVYEMVENAAGEMVRASEDPVTTGTVGAGGENTATTIVFDPITYYTAGVYEYEVVEEQGNRNGVTYSDAKFKVVVTVRENTEEGTLTAEITSITKVLNDAGEAGIYPDDTTIAFTNAYEPEKLNLALYLDVDKVLTGRPMDVSEFDFMVTLVQKDGVAVTDAEPSYGDNQASADGVAAAIKFASFTVDEAGTYVYAITESTVAAPNVTTDAKTIYVKVKVSDDTTTGKLYIADTDKILYAEDIEFTKLIEDPIFTNTYTPTPVEQELIGTKYLTGMDLRADQFTFTAALQQKNADGEWEAVKDADGNDVILTDTNDENGLVDFGAYEFTAAGEYRWVIEENNPDPNPADDTYDGTMNYDTSTYYVNVTVADSSSTGALSITSVTYQKGTEDATAVVFNNAFVPFEQPGQLSAVMNPEGSKVLDGREMRDGEFTFTVTDVQGHTVATGANDAAGNIIFDYDVNTDGVQNNVEDGHGIKFSAVGTYFYTITEDSQAGNGYSGAKVTYDPAKWTVRFDVTQDKVTGKLIVSDPVIVAVTDSTASDISEGVVFTNTYDPVDAEVVLKAYKTLEGRDLIAGEFEFHVLNSAGNVVAKGYNDADGVITFEKLVFSAATPAGAPHEFTVVEVANGDDNITYDSTVYKVSITVNDDAERGVLVPSVMIGTESYDETKTGEFAQIKFANTHTPDPVEISIEATKKLTGREQTAGEFLFQIKDELGNVVSTGSNAADGTISFEIFKLTAAGKRTFTVSEIAGNVENMTYDDREFTVVVDVTDNNGVLSADVSYPDSGIVFENKYEEPIIPDPDPEPQPGPVRVILEGSKLLMGRALNAGEFKFEVRDDRGNVLATGLNAANGNIVFTAFELTGCGTFNLTVAEVNTGLDHIIYDQKVYAIAVEVAERDGEKVFSVTYPEGGLKFVNVYDETYEPGDPYNPNVPEGGNVDTGDHTVIALWAVLSGLSGTAAAGTAGLRAAFRKRRKHEHEAH